MISLIKHNSRNHLFLTDILRVIYCVNGYYLVITLSLLVKHPETVSGLKSEEVNRPGIDLRKRHNQLRGAASRQHIVPKGRFDRHIGVLSCALDRFGAFPDLKRIGRAEHHTVNLVALIDDIFQHRPDSASCSACVKLVICLDLVAGSHLRTSKIVSQAAAIFIASFIESPRRHISPVNVSPLRTASSERSKESGQKPIGGSVSFTSSITSDSTSSIFLLHPEKEQREKGLKKQKE